MVALLEGTKAPEIKLKALDGSAYSLIEILKGSPHAVVAFFKVGCPVCQFTFPYLERLHKAHPDYPIIGVSQDDADDTRAFATTFGVSFPILLDEALQSTVDYDIETVPTIFLVDKNCEIKQTIVGFAKQDLEDLHKTLSVVSSRNGTLFTVQDDVPAYRPG